MEVERIYKHSYAELMKYPDEVKRNHFTFQKSFIEIVHPYATYYDGRHVIIKAEFEGETYLGKPHGLGLL